MPALNEISPHQLNRLIGTPDAPVLFDTRIDQDFAQDPQLIPGAIRCAHTDLPAMQRRLAQRNTDKAVVYCQKGRKISHGVAALLRQSGQQVEVLEGGQFAWRDAGLPMISGQLDLPRDPSGATRWVTRHRPKIDRIACPWLIRRFIDTEAQFLFVPPQDVSLVAEKFNATPFDVEDVQFSHRGESCTFDTILQDFGLHSDALTQMATVIRGADTNKHDLAPQAAGLLALSTGLSRMYRDDIAQLDAGMLLYDALFRWARDAMSEGHDWPQAR
ncbi:molybdopterin biosynthesis protein MoeB [Roseovarius albus]|uniref:Molybdopterin biosynthesis protein MoeB n=1 Tax=Roseovarius albus TaxID=1247867 RepID=A0A1X6ZBX8_9RHOB|nr:sulfurtransferase/chromate resistance protein [Roseovarius albus]SLN46540.1 molybdopterin biosynthesis protein MoeB [Roseovarius albus]